MFPGTDRGMIWAETQLETHRSRPAGPEIKVLYGPYKDGARHNPVLTFLPITTLCQILLTIFEGTFVILDVMKIALIMSRLFASVSSFNDHTLSTSMQFLFFRARLRRKSRAFGGRVWGGAGTRECVGGSGSSA